MAPAELFLVPARDCVTSGRLPLSPV